MSEVLPAGAAIPTTADIFVNPARLRFDPQRARFFSTYVEARASPNLRAELRQMALEHGLGEIDHSVTNLSR